MLIFPLSFPAHTFHPWRGEHDTYFSALVAMSSCTCNWIAVSGLGYSQNLFKTVVPFPSKGSTNIFYSISSSSFLYLLSACHWDSKQIRFRVRGWSSAKPTQRRWLSPETAAPVSAPPAHSLCHRAQASWEQWERAQQHPDPATLSCEILMKESLQQLQLRALFTLLKARQTP